MKKLMAILTIGLLISPLMVSAEDEIDGGLSLIRTTVYYASPGAKTSTGKEARYGIVAFDPQYYGKTCILYTENREYIGIFECEDTGGRLVRSGQRLDVYTGTTIDTCYEWANTYGTYCYVQWLDAEG